MRITSPSWRRYTLRLLFAVVTIVGILSAFAAKATKTLRDIAIGHEQLNSVISSAHPTVAQQAVIENGHSSIAGNCKSGGFAMVTFECIPDWLSTIAKLLGRESVPQITEIQIVSGGFDDSQLDVLSNIGTLRSIQFDGTKITDSGLAEFCEKSNVKYIRIGQLNEGITSTGRELAAQKNAGEEYTPKWPPPS